MGNPQIVMYVIGGISFILINLIFYLASYDKKAYSNLLQTIYIIGIIGCCLKSIDLAVGFSLYMLVILVGVRVINYK
jgi:hypothetical protein